MPTTLIRLDRRDLVPFMEQHPILKDRVLEGLTSNSRFQANLIVSLLTRPLAALVTPDDRHDALRAAAADQLRMGEPRQHIAGLFSGLDIHYDLAEGHRLLGRRMPDLDLNRADGPTRVFALLRKARPMLLGLADRVRAVDATYDGV